MEGRWIKDPSSRFFSSEEQAPTLKLTENEKSWLAEHPQISIGGDANWAPIDFVDGGKLRIDVSFSGKVGMIAG